MKAGAGAILGLLLLVLPACFPPSPNIPEAEPSTSPEPSNTTEPAATPTRTPIPAPALTYTPIPTSISIPPTATSIVFEATSSPTQSPVSTATSRPPTPTAAPAVTSTATPQPTVQPSPTPEAELSPNLTFFAPREWDGPFVIADEVHVRQNAEQLVGEESFISVAIANEGITPQDEDLFFTDLYFDDIPVERWRNTITSPHSRHFIEDWDDLSSRVNISYGEHVLKYVVDSTNLIDESDETDNIIERTVFWDPPDDIVLDKTPTITRLPDLAPFVPDGWDSPLIVSPYKDGVVDRPLSIDDSTLVKFSVENKGLTSISQEILVYVYFDDVLVDSYSWQGLLAGQFIRTDEWDGLNEIVNLTSGAHKIRLEIDPTNLIPESDEDNNILEEQFFWSFDELPPQPPEPTPAPPQLPDALSLPNLVPGWRFGQDGPIIVSHTQDTAFSEPLGTSNVPYIDLVVHNLSGVPATGEFSFALYFDDELVRRFDFNGLVPPDAFMRSTDWAGLPEVVDISEGTHTLKLVIDPDNTFPESDESDNVFEQTFEWSAGQLEPVEFIQYSAEELEGMFANFAALLDVQEPPLPDEVQEYAPEVLNIVDGAYYLTTGRSIHDERVDIYLLTENEYFSWIDGLFLERSAVASHSAQEALFLVHERYKTVDAFKTRRFGKVALVINAERRPVDVINSIAHELGHMRQDFLNPEQTEADGSQYYLIGLQEGQAQQFERAFWLTLQSFMGKELYSYPDFDVFKGFISSRYNFWLNDFENDEHSLGYLLQWLAVLDDPELSHLRDELLDSGKLGASSSLELYDYFVAMERDQVQQYVEERLLSLEDNIASIEEISNSRLEAELQADDEGPATLRTSALLMP